MKRKYSKYNKSGFKVPENYFENFEKELMDVLFENPEINCYKGNPGFEVPNAYFDNLEEEILQKVDKPGEKGKLLSLYKDKKLLYIAAIAAIFIGIISTVYYNPVSPEFSFDTIELSTLENYIDEGNIDYNYNEISSFITEEGPSANTFITSGLSDEDVFKYLTENVEDSRLLYE